VAVEHRVDPGGGDRAPHALGHGARALGRLRGSPGDGVRAAGDPAGRAVPGRTARWRRSGHRNDRRLRDSDQCRLEGASRARRLARRERRRRHGGGDARGGAGGGFCSRTSSGPRRADDAHGTDDVSVPVLLEARRLVVEYGPGLRVLDGVDLVLRRGEAGAITGPSGSGKSTLLAPLAGLRRPDGGEVWFDGRALASRTSSELDRFRAEWLGFVFQRAALLAFLTVRENVCLALGCLDPRQRGERASRIEPLLQWTGLLPL